VVSKQLFGLHCIKIVAKNYQTESRNDFLIPTVPMYKLWLISLQPSSFAILNIRNLSLSQNKPIPPISKRYSLAVCDYEVLAVYISHFDGASGISFGHLDSRIRQIYIYSSIIL
jgi:hypothetical protein